MAKTSAELRAESIIARQKLCAWPLCGHAPDRNIVTPLCRFHGLLVSDLYRQRAAEAVWKRTAAERAQRRVDPVRMAQTTGQIYYVRLNDVIKIGWSSQLQGRLHDYGAGAELLAHHPGSRADERDLHRSFAPLRVHAREWYDGSAQIILDHIDAMLAKYGPPLLKVERNGPTGQQTGKHWTGRKAG